MAIPSAGPSRGGAITPSEKEAQRQEEYYRAVGMVRKEFANEPGKYYYEHPDAPGSGKNYATSADYRADYANRAGVAAWMAANGGLPRKAAGPGPQSPLWVDRSPNQNQPNSSPAGSSGGPVPIGPQATANYAVLPSQQSRFNANQGPVAPKQAARLPWMQQQDGSQALAQQQALIQALRGTNG